MVRKGSPVRVRTRACPSAVGIGVHRLDYLLELTAGNLEWNHELAVGDVFCVEARINLVTPPEIA
jgi:hypothetical protein